jgi:RNA polymerase sigma factor (sigma-70 family)
MPQDTLRDLFRFLRRHVARPEGPDLSDGDLLRRFLEGRDEAAFEALLGRHGPMVLGVCRRVTGDDHAAEDAFQATFLVLARRAGAIRNQASVGSWLFGVAQRVAGKASARAAARRERERRAADMRSDKPLDEPTWQELRSVLDEEVGRLPEKCRAPLVLCYFEGKSYDQAAQELGCPKSTLASRLAKAHQLLRGQLVRRGITLSAGALTTALAEKATAAPVRAMLAMNLVKAAANVAAAKPVAQGVLSAEALALAEDALKTMTGTRGKLAALLLALGLAAGAAFAGYEMWVRPAPTEQQPPVAPGDPPRKVAPGVAVDLNGDPLPAGAFARLGQDRWLHHYNMARFAAFLPDGKAVVTVSVDRTIQVWDFPSGKERLRIPLPGPNLTTNQRIQAALSPDGQTIATWIMETASVIYLHDLATRKRLSSLPVSTSVRALSFSPDGVHLASLTTVDGTVRIWDWARAKEVSKFVAGPPATVGSVPFVPGNEMSYTPDGKALVTLVGKQVKSWDPATGDPLATPLNEKKYAAGTLAFSRDGKRLALSVATDKKDPAVVLVDLATGKQVGKLTAPQDRFNINGGMPGLVFDKAGKRLYASAYGSGLFEWDVATGKLLRQYFPAQGGGPANGVALSPDGNFIVRTGAGPPLLDLRGKEIRLIYQRSGPMVAVQFTPDGKHVLTLNRGVIPTWIAVARKWEAAIGKDLGPVDLHGLKDPIAISPDHRYLAGKRGDIDEDGQVKGRQTVLIERASGKELPVMPADRSPARLRFSPDSKLLALGRSMPPPLPKEKGKIWKNNDGQIGLYDLTAGKLRRPLELQGGLFNLQEPSQMWRTLIFSPDSKLLAAHADPQTLGIWDTTTGRRVGSLPLPRGGLLVITAVPHDMDSAAFSPDGRSLVLDHDDGTAVLYDWATGQSLRTFGTKVAPKELPKKKIMSHILPDELKGHSCFAFSPDGKRLARGGYDHVVRVWDVQTGRPLAEFKGHKGAVTALAFSPNGRRLASASADSTALMWDVSKLKR